MSKTVCSGGHPGLNTPASVSVFPFLLGRENSLTGRDLEEAISGRFQVCALSSWFPTERRFLGPQDRPGKKESGAGFVIRTGRQWHTLPCSSELASACTSLSPLPGNTAEQNLLTPHNWHV